MKMNLPNKLTMLRVFMIPVFVLLMYGSYGVEGEAYMQGASDHAAYFSYMGFRIAACAVFCLASFTDFLDGYIARKNHLVTNFGKFMDPLADKLLVCSALILLTGEGLIPAWMTCIIIGREFIISGFRLVASDNGVVIAASWWGKWKTVTQMLSCIMLILYAPMEAWLGTAGITAANLMLWISLILTLISLFDYIWKNKKVITEGGM